ncbi:MAG: hypothetical protein BVN34_09110 [Proteobacteria bacterium ST_bin12]|nr:MAG: hypothetical protein BVN34_09110 [Proteobacteria bacterium ST_bin12]
MISKDFLLIECENLRSVLKETLGYNYGIEGTTDFYVELTTRLDFIQAQLESIPENDAINLQPYPAELNLISTLISRIERSCLGEYSWPFVTELKKIATTIWAQNERIGTNIQIHEGEAPKPKVEINTEDAPPMMFVLSEGGLAAYAIGIEPKRASTSRMRILTIQFPRTLKHYVLLHPILGHELGHALYKISKFRTGLTKILDSLVQSSAKINSVEATRDWIFDDKNAPNDYKINLIITCKKMSMNKDNFEYKVSWESWKEEILCDLIGILIFGPSFLAALVTLLSTLDTSGLTVKPKHPIAASRINMILLAAKILNYDNFKLADAGFEATARKFWEHMALSRKDDPWFDLFTEADLTKALTSLNELLNQNNLVFYPQHSTDIIEPLVKKLSKLIPPVGYKVEPAAPDTSFHVDFRHILYAGWLVSEHMLPIDEAGGEMKKIDFNILNRLCEHGIMQQIAIDLR